jgi:hypothetical protein
MPHGLHRLLRRGRPVRSISSSPCRHGNMIRLLARFGLAVDLIEVEIPPDATTEFPMLPDGWVQRRPREEVWFARRLG